MCSFVLAAMVRMKWVPAGPKPNRPEVAVERRLLSGHIAATIAQGELIELKQYREPMLPVRAGRSFSPWVPSAVVAAVRLRVGLESLKIPLSER